VILNLDEGEVLVKLARDSIKSYLRSRRLPTAPANVPSKLSEKSGVFVTLKKAKEGMSLRGCIGYTYPNKQLVDATIESAIEAATNDPRFEPVSLRELDSEIVIEVSVLTPPVELSVNHPREYPNRIIVGRHGLIVRRGIYQGLLLPQVAVEWRWDPEEFLSNCCLKAALPPDAWLERDTKIMIFEAKIFRENSPNGPISMEP